MPDYRRARVPGATCFFTNLHDRRSDLQIREIEPLRETVRAIPFISPPGWRGMTPALGRRPQLVWEWR